MINVLLQNVSPRNFSHGSVPFSFFPSEDRFVSAKSMTSGSPFRILLSFALPLMAGNVFQQLYTMVDSMVVGKVLGLSALAAVGNGEWLNWLVLSMIQGFTQGFSIRLAQDFGANDTESLKNTYAVSRRLSAFCTVGLLLFAFLTLRPILTLLKTPSEIFPMSVSYLSVIFAGIPIVMAYNFYASVLRALGDSKTPLRAMAAASACNVALDLLFVIVFHWGIAGAAAATLIGQTLSALVCRRALRKFQMLREAKSEAGDFRNTAAALLRLATPFVFQNTIIAVGGLVVQFVINGYGVLYIAGFTATNKLYGILEMAATSYGFALTTYVGQNYGAGEIPRIGKGVHTGAVMGIVTAGLIGLAMLLVGKHIVGAFISGPPEDAAASLEIAYHYLSVMAAFLPILYILHIYRSSLQGLGNTVMPMVSGAVELVMRVGTVFLLPRLVGSEGLFWAEVLAWVGADVVLLLSYYIQISKIKNAWRKEGSGRTSLRDEA